MAIDFTPGQAEKRRQMIFLDQHGRKWTAAIELRTGFPVGSVNPIGFETRFPIEQKYMRFFRNRPGYMEIDYDAMLRDRDASEGIYKQRIQAAARKLYGDKAGEALKKPTTELLEAAGTKPAPRERILAAKAGNKWVLGLTDLKPDWADKFFPEEQHRDIETGRLLVSDEELQGMFPDVEVDEEVLV
jgi:hypothetical protein